MSSPSSDKPMPPDDKPRSVGPDAAAGGASSGKQPSSDNADKAGAADSASGSSTPPPGSKGYRKMGDPLPRGIPLTGSSRRSGSSSSSSSSSSKPVAGATGSASSTGSTPPSPTRPQSPTSDVKPLPKPQTPSVRPPTPQPIQPSIGDTSSVLASPKVPRKDTPARPAHPVPPPAAAPPTYKATAAPLYSTPVAAAAAKSKADAAAAAAASAGAGATAGAMTSTAQASGGAGTPLPPGEVYLPSETSFPSPVDRRGMVMLIAILFSLTAHGVLAWQLYDRPLSHIDPDLIHKQRDVYRVFRAPQDMILPDNASDPDGVTADGKKPEPAEPESPLTDLSIAMLGAPAQDQPAPAITPELNPNNRPFDDAKPQTPEPQGTQGLPDIQLPDNIQQQMLVEIPLATLFVGTGGSSNKGKGQGSDPNATKSNGSGSGQDQAASLLANTDAFGEGMGLGNGSGNGSFGGAAGNPLAPTMPAPTLTDKASINDQRALPLDLMPNPIDLSSITDDAATRLSIPEHLDNDFEYSVTSFIPKGGWGVPADEERGYFRVDITAKRSLKKLQTMPKDLVILVDTSGSVPQEWLDRTLSGIRDSLSSLNPNDRFNIVFFAEKTAVLGPDGNLPVTEENLAKARTFLSSGKSGGNTDVNQALSRLLVRDVAVDRAYELILISDGRPTSGVMNTRELINLITRDNDLAASIYCLGIGTRQNKTLLEFLAYRNKGFCVFADNPFQAAIGIRDLVSRLRYPIMKDIRLSVLGLNIEEVFPSDLPTIHQGETFSIYGRFDNPGKPFTMRLIGHNGQQMFDFTFTRDLAQMPVGEEQISRDWGFWKLHHIYNQILRQGESRELRATISYLRRKYKLETVYD